MTEPSFVPTVIGARSRHYEAKQWQQHYIMRDRNIMGPQFGNLL
jgi:hypothetical protein